MDHYILTIVILLFMVIVGSHATTAPETYWKSVLPNTPIPLTLRNSLPNPESIKNKGVAQVAKSGRWEYAAASQFYVDPTRALFFLEKDLKVGSHMTFEFTKSVNHATFLTREEANAIPFSSDKVPQILSKFSLKPDSTDAQIMKETIKGCESKGIRGDEKYCATSLESMIDYATSTLGKNIKAISTVKRYINNKVDKYTITGIKKTAKEDKNTVCHKENYAYAVFYCHKTTTTTSFLVSLVGSKGSWVNAVAVCHTDTSGWNPKHFAFQVLNIKPGTVPVCHFLAEDQVLWVPDN